MAKNSLFWGKATGKLGEVVLYRAGGEQRSRTYVQKIKNPKSLAQMEQRIKMASLVGFYKAARVILKNSFASRPTRQSGFNAMVQQSLPIATTAISRQLAEEGYSVPLNYRISSGSVTLPVGSFAPIALEAGDFVGALQFMQQPSAFPIAVVDFANADTAGSALDTWLTLNPSLSEMLPSKFNICVIWSEYADEGFVTNYRVFRVDRSGGACVVEGDFLPTESGIMPFATLADEGATFKLPALLAGKADSGNGCWMGGAFISFTDAAGKLNVSSAGMSVIHDADSYIEQFQKNGIVYEDYLANLGVGASDVLATN